jgi:hypothetical protein
MQLSNSNTGVLFPPQNVIGCFTMMLNLIEDNAVIIGAVGLGIAALEVQYTCYNTISIPNSILFPT